MTIMYCQSYNTSSLIINNNVTTKNNNHHIKNNNNLIHYLQTHPNTTLTYNQTNMKMIIHSDASYRSEPKACSRSSGYYSFPSPNHMKSPFHIDTQIIKMWYNQKQNLNVQKYIQTHNYQHIHI